MDAVSSVPPILSSSLWPHRAPARRLPTRVVRHGPGRRRSGRFVQLWKEQSFILRLFPKNCISTLADEGWLRELPARLESSRSSCGSSAMNSSQKLCRVE
jgi:hypothetical protein